MTGTGIESNTDTILKRLNKKLGEKFEELSLHGAKHYKLPDGEIIILCELLTFEAIVVEYADNLEEAERNRFEDGKLFYFSDYQDEKELLKAILSEIEEGY